MSNDYDDFNASAVGYGVGRLDEADAMIREVNQSDWDIVGAVEVTSSDYYIKFGITQPEDPNADLDLYIFYFPTYEDLMNFTNYTLYDEQVGPTSDEVFEKFMPEPGYYFIAVYGYDTVNYNPIQYVFYYQILGDNGNISVDSTPFTFTEGTSKTIKATVELNNYGTYLGVMGLVDSDTGEALTYAPMIFQVGSPEMFVAVYSEATLGKQSVLKIKLLDLATMQLINAPAKVIVNGREYYTDNGEVDVYFVPLKFEETFNIYVISDYYMDYSGTFTVKVNELAGNEVYDATHIKPYIATGLGSVTKINVSDSGTMIGITAEGPSGTIGYLLVTLPGDTQYVKVAGDHVLEYYILEGQNAVYTIVKVRYASPVTVTIEYKTARYIVSTWNYVWYMLYWRYDQKFDPLYQKAVELGVDNETLQEAMRYKELADEYYAEAKKYMNPYRENLAVAALPYVRKAYLNIFKAYTLLEEAVNEIEGSEG
ncbi:hypothetical protein [Thermococcus piezophilus]|uniref:hypothetical protein n=1 Tax=Thermococcus piezophilus TaxID=1712654 RepID=UPI000AD46468|nr:hypothetical protein [Thermococcus piezophilus]